MAIETILAERNSPIFAELKHNGQVIIANQDVIWFSLNQIKEQEINILHSIDSHQHGNEQYWDEERELNHEELRRLDEILQRLDRQVEREELWSGGGRPIIPKR